MLSNMKYIILGKFMDHMNYNNSSPTRFPSKRGNTPSKLPFRASSFDMTIILPDCFCFILLFSLDIIALGICSGSWVHFARQFQCVESGKQHHAQNARSF